MYADKKARRPGNEAILKGLIPYIISMQCQCCVQGVLICSYVTTLHDPGHEAMPHCVTCAGITLTDKLYSLRLLHVRVSFVVLQTFNVTCLEQSSPFDVEILHEDQYYAVCSDPS